jgi:hypothetical protein
MAAAQAKTPTIAWRIPAARGIEQWHQQQLRHCASPAADGMPAKIGITAVTGTAALDPATTGAPTTAPAAVFPLCIM